MSRKTNLTKSDLQLIASKLGIEGFLNMQKAELIDAVKAVGPLYSESSVESSEGISSSQSNRASVITRVLAIASLIISLVSVIYTRQQTLVLQKDLEIQGQQYYAEMTAEWDELRQTMFDIVTSAPLGIDALSTLSRQEKIEWIRRQEELLNSQAGNPVLIGDQLSLGYWRNAMASARTTRMVFEIESVDSETVDNLFIASASSIFNDVAFVWKRLVLESDQVSPTGGRPDVEDE